MHTMQQTHAQVCTRAYISKKKIPEGPQKKLQVKKRYTGPLHIVCCGHSPLPLWGAALRQKLPPKNLS